MNQLDAVEIKPFNYQSVDRDTAQYLKEKESNIITIANNTYTAVGRELKDAQDRLSQKGYGCFEEWYTSLGYKKTSVYNLINRFKLIECSSVEQTNLLESLPANLTYEISKPSANPELKQAVLGGDIKTHKEYKELEREKKAAERRAQQAEAEKQELAEARWQDISTINEMSKKISELEAREPEVVEKVVEKEVVPDEILEKLERRKQDVKFWKSQTEQIHADYENIKNEHLALKAQIDNKFKGFDEQLLDFSAFKSDINTFLRKVTPLIYLGDSFSKLSSKESEKYKEQIELVELWLDDIKAALGGSKGGANMVIIQGGE